MGTQTLTHDEFLKLIADLPVKEVNVRLPLWFDRGDGAAIYQNEDLGHPNLGEVRLVSFGSPDAQLEVSEPPLKLPDIGGQINWRFWLKGIYRGDS